MHPDRVTILSSYTRGVGLGKTHLLHAIGHVCASRGLSVLYATSEQFTNEFISAIRNRTTEEFRGRYRSVQVLLMDDVQFLSGKEQTHEGFFHTFNDLHNSGNQVVITSDRSPRALALLEDRLRSRFEWGLITDIQPPNLETRMAISGLQGGPTWDRFGRKHHRVDCQASPEKRPRTGRYLEPDCCLFSTDELPRHSGVHLSYYR